MNICKSFVALITAILLSFGLISVGPVEITDVPEQQTGTVRVISFNVRYANDIYGSIENRSTYISETLRAYAPDSFGVQEANPEWLEQLENKLGDQYARVGEGRNLDKDTEYCCVYYLKDKYNLIDSGTLWLSETPDEPGSKDYLTTYPRICTWATLENKETGETYTHVNTHLDHILEYTRKNQAKVLKGIIQELSETAPVVCTGDFNASEHGDSYKLMTGFMDDARLVAKETEKGKTFHNYGRGDLLHTTAIDFIFVPKGAEVTRYKIIDNMVNNMYLSDHYGICVDAYIS